MKQERLSAGPGGIEPPTIGLEGRSEHEQPRDVAGAVPRDAERSGTDLAALCQAVVDAGRTACVWPVNAPTSALLKALMPVVGDKSSPLYDTARAILAALDAERAQGYARAIGEVAAEVQTRTEAAVSSYYADRSSYREGYSDACDTLCELVQHMAQTPRD